MSQWYCSVCDEILDDENKPGVCKICQADDRMIMKMDEIPKSLEQVRDLARKKLKS